MTRKELEKRLIGFAKNGYKINLLLSKTLKGNHMGDQIYRSSTSAALNYGEVQGAASRKDFIHKNRIVLKELREKIIALHIVQGTQINNNETLDSMIKENNELIAIFVKSIKTAENNSKKV